MLGDEKFWRVLWRLEEKSLISMRIAWTHSILRLVRIRTIALESTIRDEHYVTQPKVQLYSTATKNIGLDSNGSVAEF